MTDLFHDHPAVHPASSAAGAGAETLTPDDDLRPDEALEAHGRLAFGGTWATMIEADRDFWRARYVDVVRQGKA